MSILELNMWITKRESCHRWYHKFD